MATHGNVTKRTVELAATVLITEIIAIAAGCGSPTASIPPIHNPGGRRLVQGG